MIYCIVPTDLEWGLGSTLGRHFRDDSCVEVVRERRHGERRQRERRRPDEVRPPAVRERRAMGGPRGRRVAERRMPVAHATGRPLPRRVRRHAQRIGFVEHVAPDARVVEDADSDRLVTRIQGGDMSAFDAMYLRYVDRVFSYLRMLLRDTHEAEDFTQEVFIKVLRAVPRYAVEPGRPFRAWLFRIARNHAMDRLEKMGRVEVLDPHTLQDRGSGQEDRTEALALRWISDDDLMLLIELMPLAQRQVVTLQFLLEMTTAEIAHVLDRTPESVRQLRSRALKHLETRLTASGRVPVRAGRQPMMRVLRQATVLRHRRFALR
jgi:RNA polymerase sigma-70 factor (ECF subfamily)